MTRLVVTNFVHRRPYARDCGGGCGCAKCSDRRGRAYRRDARSISEIRSDINKINQEMKQDGIRKISVFNAGISREESHYNGKLFALKTELERARKEQGTTDRATERGWRAARDDDFISGQRVHLSENVRHDQFKGKSGVVSRVIKSRGVIEVKLDDGRLYDANPENVVKDSYRGDRTTERGWRAAVSAEGVGVIETSPLFISERRARDWLDDHIERLKRAGRRAWGTLRASFEDPDKHFDSARDAAFSEAAAHEAVDQYRAGAITLEEAERRLLDMGIRKQTIATLLGTRVPTGAESSHQSRRGR